MPMVPAPRIATRRGATLRASSRCQPCSTTPSGSARRPISLGTPSASGIRLAAGTATYSAIAPRLPRFTPMSCLLRNDGSPSSGLGAWSAMMLYSATRVPGAGALAPGPSRATVPETSCPITMPGARRPLSPVKPCTSLPQMPTVSTRSSASPSPGSGAGRSTTLMSQGPLYRTAFIAAQHTTPVGALMRATVAGSLPALRLGRPTVSALVQPTRSCFTVWPLAVLSKLRIIGGVKTIPSELASMDNPTVRDNGDLP